MEAIGNLEHILFETCEPRSDAIKSQNLWDLSEELDRRQDVELEGVQQKFYSSLEKKIGTFGVEGDPLLFLFFHRLRWGRWPCRGLRPLKAGNAHFP